MPNLPKDFRLFQKAELEYITPFLKLWLSFNCWYKKDSEADDPPIDTDRKAIEKYKSGGQIKHHFLRIFENTSTEGKKFAEAIGILVLNSEETYELKDKDGNRIRYSQDKDNQIRDLLIKNPTQADIIRDNLILVGEGREKYYIRPDKKDEFFAETLEIIYNVRCTLVHGDFDIDDQFFIQLIESSYKIMYSVIERVLE